MSWNLRKKAREAQADADALNAKKFAPEVRVSVSESVSGNLGIHVANLRSHLDALEQDEATRAEMLEGVRAEITEVKGCIEALEPAVKGVAAIAGKFVETPRADNVRKIAKNIDDEAKPQPEPADAAE